MYSPAAAVSQAPDFLAARVVAGFVGHDGIGGKSGERSIALVGVECGHANVLMVSGVHPILWSWPQGAASPKGEGQPPSRPRERDGTLGRAPPC